MGITSLVFCLFLIISLLCYWKIKNNNRKYIILLTNVVFYLSYGWLFAVILFAIICVSYLCARAFDKGAEKAKLLATLCIILFPLISIKYTAFALRLISPFCRFNSLSLKIIAPLGISYYTFQAISYVVDVYKGKVQSEKDFLNYAVYMSFFQQ